MNKSKLDLESKLKLRIGGNAKKTYLEHPKMIQKSHWENCGLAVGALLDIMKSEVLVGLKLVDQISLKGTVEGDLEKLYAALTTDRDTYTILDIAIFGVHQFILDIRPGLGVALFQGYQFRYGCLWWAGFAQRGKPEANEVLLQKDVPKIVELAREWGKCQRIELSAFASLLCELFAEVYYQDSDALNVWRKLPFGPTDTEVVHKCTKARSKEEIIIKIDHYQVTGNATIAAAQFGSKYPHSDFICGAICEAEAKRLEIHDPWL
ncbi:MAG: hypothetical protein QM820_40545 [Minicystis sp.]